MIPEDEELNFAISPDSPRHWQIDGPEPEAVEEDLPLLLGAGRPPRPLPIGTEVPVGLGILFVLLAGIFIAANVHSDGPRPDAPSTNAQASATAQASVDAQQPSAPEYFPAGWDYVRRTQPTQIFKDRQALTIPQGLSFFVSLRIVNGFCLAVAEDGSWNGWVRITGIERQIPMHPDFSGAKKFVTEIDWSHLASSTPLEVPSQEAGKTDPEALRASAAETERSDMALFEKKEKEQPAEITVQGDEAFIPQPVGSEEEEKKVKLPKTKWYGEGGASAPPFSRWRWVCMSRDGLRCGLQDANGAYVQHFFWNGGSVQASAVSTGALFPRGLVWGCAKLPGVLWCSIFDSRKINRQGCAYDGEALGCGN